MRGEVCRPCSDNFPLAESGPDREHRRNGEHGQEKGDGPYEKPPRPLRVCFGFPLPCPAPTSRPLVLSKPSPDGVLSRPCKRPVCVLSLLLTAASFRSFRHPRGQSLLCYHNNILTNTP